MNEYKAYLATFANGTKSVKSNIIIDLKADNAYEAVQKAKQFVIDKDNNTDLLKLLYVTDNKGFKVNEFE